MSQAIRRLSTLRRELHQLKATIRLNEAISADEVIEGIEGILRRDQERIEHRGQG